MTPVSATSFDSSICAPLPLTRPPPWMNTCTGRLSRAVVPAGRHTLMTRQSSVSLRGPFVLGRTGHGFPNWVTSRTPVHVAADCGGHHRNAPVGAAAYGMPRKRSPPPVTAPRTAPRSVTTVGDVSADAVAAGNPIAVKRASGKAEHATARVLPFICASPLLRDLRRKAIKKLCCTAVPIRAVHRGRAFSKERRVHCECQQGERIPTVGRFARVTSSDRRAYGRNMHLDWRRADVQEEG